MGAIAGVVFGDGQSVPSEIPARMVAATAHHSAVAAATWFEGPAALIRFPHATTPEAVSERQPSRSSCSGSVLCFEGRLDNRAEVLALLETGAAAMRDAPDSTLVLALFDRLGEAAIARFVGDYALAWWQPSARKLFCARSPIGWRSFYWCHEGARFAFASEPRALIVGLDLDRALNLAVIGELLSTRIVTQTETFWRALHRLEQGCALTFERGEVRIRRWYDPACEDVSSLSDADHVDRFNELFDQALVAVTRSDRPVAAHLSGGLDSSSVLARATELYRAGRIAQPVTAVSVRYPGEPQDESAFSGSVERHLGVVARIVGDQPYDLAAAGLWSAQTLQLPVRPNTLGPTQAVCAGMQSRGETVLLTGEGGDDWMNGGRAHWPDLLLRGKLRELLREGVATGAGPMALRVLASQTLGPIFSARRRHRLSWPIVPLHGVVPVWIRSDWARSIGLYERLEQAPLLDLPSFAQRQRYAMMGSPYRDAIFDSIQAMAQRYGVELRHPLHDLRLVRFLMGARGDMLRRGATRKYLLREAMRDTLPEIVRTRQSKANFSAPIIDTLARYFEQHPPESLLPVDNGWVDGVALRHLFEPHRKWRASGSTGTAPNSALAGLWFVVSMDLWLRHVGVR